MMHCFAVLLLITCLYFLNVCLVFSHDFVAPKLFVLAYNLIKGVLSSRTTGKVHVLGSNWQEVLRNVIDPDDLPKAYGGNKVDENGDPYFSAHVCLYVTAMAFLAVVWSLLLNVLTDK